MTLIQVAAPARQRRRVTFKSGAERVEWTAAAYRQGWLSSRHSLPAELALVLGVYAVYEGTRGLVAGDANLAQRHAQDIVSLERSLHIFVEGSVQHAALAVPGLTGTLGFAYLTLHLVATAGLLLWLYRRRPAAYPFIRTTLVLASALAMVGYVVFPTAPPRLTDVGIVDTVSGRHVDLNKGLISSLYNPYAAVPSMHAGYALIVGASLVRNARRLIVRLAGLAYPPFVLLLIVATGNHFFVDAAAGAAVVGVALLAAWLVFRPWSVPGPSQSSRQARSETSIPNAAARATSRRAA